MSKLIKLPDGPYVDASSIIKITPPEYYDSCWHYTIWYGSPISSHNVHMSATFVKSQDKAEEHLQRFVNGVNFNR